MFIDQATKPASLGIAVVPTYKGLRYPALSNWQGMATIDMEKIAEWASNGYADFNCVCVAKEEGTGRKAITSTSCRPTHPVPWATGTSKLAEPRSSK